MQSQLIQRIKTDMETCKKRVPETRARRYLGEGGDVPLSLVTLSTPPFGRTRPSFPTFLNGQPDAR
jgi:hypothetical protein